jgi:ABC-type Fe3+/spermidine/putrescine transport system ATPase subunit
MEGLEVEELTVRFTAAGSRVVLRIDRVAVKRGEQASFPCSRPGGEALLWALAGLDPEVEGRILVDGKPASGRDVHERRIAVVPEGGGLLPHLTVRENILYGAAPDLTADRSVTQEILPVLERDLQLTPAGGRRPDQLSTRELILRVGLARAAISEPAAIVVHLPYSLEAPERLPQTLAAAVVRRARHPAVLVLTDDPGVLRAIPAVERDRS